MIPSAKNPNKQKNTPADIALSLFITRSVWAMLTLFFIAQ